MATSDFALARYNPDGSLDTNFSGDGKQTTVFGGLRRAAPGVALQSDGKIVAVGGTPGSTRLRAHPLQPQRLARHRASPATASRRPSSVLRGLRQASEVAIQGDGKIVAVGPLWAYGLRTSPSPATTRTARWIRASPATACRRPTSAWRRRRPGWRSKGTAGSSRSAQSAR